MRVCVRTSSLCMYVCTLERGEDFRVGVGRDVLFDGMGGSVLGV